MRTVRHFLSFSLVVLIIFTFDICYAQGFHASVSSPLYDGGLKALNEFIMQNIHYPENHVNDGITGVVTLNYTINEQGKVENIKILRGLNTKYDSEAVRVTQLITGWQPAVQWGKPISTRVTMPIEFCLKHENQKERTIIVTGNVSNKVTYTPVEGALILVKGTNIGATTNKNGNYILTVPDEGSQLEFSSLGYSEKSEKVDKNRIINVELLPEDLVIDFSSD